MCARVCVLQATVCTQDRFEDDPAMLYGLLQSLLRRLGGAGGDRDDYDGAGGGAPCGTAAVGVGFGGARPSRAHAFIRSLASGRPRRLLRVYSQNVDGLEAAAGLNCGDRAGARRDVVLVHGTLTTCVCTACGRRCAFEEVAGAVRQGRVPRCPASLPPPRAPLRGVARAAKASCVEPRATRARCLGSAPAACAGEAPAATGAPCAPGAAAMGGEAAAAAAVAAAEPGTCGGVMRPDIVFFNEPTGASGGLMLSRDAAACDLVRRKTKHSVMHSRMLKLRAGDRDGHIPGGVHCVRAV